MVERELLPRATSMVAFSEGRPVDPAGYKQRRSAARDLDGRRGKRPTPASAT
jgi:hypothetical protein